MILVWWLGWLKCPMINIVVVSFVIMHSHICYKINWAYWEDVLYTRYLILFVLYISVYLYVFLRSLVLPSLRNAFDVHRLELFQAVLFLGFHRWEFLKTIRYITFSGYWAIAAFHWTISCNLIWISSQVTRCFHVPRSVIRRSYGWVLAGKYNFNRKAQFSYL